MTDPEEALEYLIERFIRRAELAPSGRRGPDDATLETLHEVVAVKLGANPALPQLEAAMARLRMALREATNHDPEFAANLGAALAALQWGSGQSGIENRAGGFRGSGGAWGYPQQRGYDQGYGRQGYDQGYGYAVEDVWVDDPEHEDPPEPSGRSPRT